jgi:dienelactone hydrolase
MTTVHEALSRQVSIRTGRATVDGKLAVPDRALGVVLFAHGSGSSRHSPRNIFVARVLQRAGLATLLFDLLQPDEEATDACTREYRFDVGMLSQRLADATHWVHSRDELHDLPIGYFGASTGSAAALRAAATLGMRVDAVVSRGGRPDLARDDALARVQAATLLIVGGLDAVVIELNRRAFNRLRCEKDLAIVAGASHLFEEPGTLEQVASLARGWFRAHLLARAAHR